jgi:hypothetical protein
MTHVYRISKGSDIGALVDSIEAADAFARESGPGRYHIDQITADPLPSGHTSRRWGIGIKRDDGSVVIEPDPWEA